MIALLLALFVSLQVILGEYNGAVIPNGVYQSSVPLGAATCRVSCEVISHSGLLASVVQTSISGGVTCGYQYNFALLQSAVGPTIQYTPSLNLAFCSVLTGSGSTCTPCPSGTGFNVTSTIVSSMTTNPTYTVTDPTYPIGGMVNLAANPGGVCPTSCGGIAYPASLTANDVVALTPSIMLTAASFFLSLFVLAL